MTSEVARFLVFLQPLQHLIGVLGTEFLVLLQFSNFSFELLHRLRAIFFHYYRVARCFERAEACCFDFRSPHYDQFVALDILEDEVVLGQVDDVRPTGTRFGAQVHRES